MKNKPTDNGQYQRMELTEAMLAEMQTIAVTHGAPPSLNYAMTQQIITIKSLEQFLKTYGIELPVSVNKLGGYRE